MCGSQMAIYIHLGNEKKMRNAVYWFAYVLKFDRAGIWKCVALSNFVKILINGYEGCLSSLVRCQRKVSIYLRSGG